jgi:ankyrin repeat protein
LCCGGIHNSQPNSARCFAHPILLLHKIVPDIFLQVRRSRMSSSAQLLAGLLLSEAKLGNLDEVRNLLRSAALLSLIRLSPYPANACGYADVVCELLKHDEVDVNEETNLCRNALMLASEKGNLAVVCMLLKHKMVVENAKDNDGNTAIILASGNGLVDVVHELVSVDVNGKTNLGSTSLIVAGQAGRIEVVREILKHLTYNGH